VHFVFATADRALSAEAKLSIARWLQGLDPVGRIRNWPTSFAAFFDSVFGSKHLSIQCLLRSTAASFVATAVLLLLWTALRPGESSEFWTQRGLEGLSVFITITILLNLAADYVSLLETRFILGRMASMDSANGYSMHLSVDAILTLLVWLLFFTGLPLTAGALLIPAFADALTYLRVEIWGVSSVGGGVGSGVTVRDILTLRAGPSAMPVGVWFYSTFLTSLWIWLYALSGTLTRMSPRLANRLDWARSVLNVDEDPIRALGFVVVLILTGLFAVGAAFQL
jgi:hypothetical protein